MTRRRRRLLVVVAAFLAAACGEDDAATAPPATSTSTSTSAPATPAADTADDRIEVWVTEASMVGGTSDGTVRWDVRYPQIEGSGVDAEVNEQLRGDAEAALDDWRRDAEGWGATDDLPSEYVADYEVALLDDTLLDGAVLSIVGSGSAYLSGAAHPVELVSAATFDLGSGERIMVEDLFEPTSSWRELLVSATREALAAEYGDGLDVALLDLGPSTDLSVFALTPTGLRLAFADGAIGPHALGAPSVTIPYDALAEVAAPDGLLGRTGVG
ncbi:MAG: RsiV family protein [Acidimicrobiales bacterium]|nr:RsiV family protein [Acidimicrobiales bacterium]